MATLYQRLGGAKAIDVVIDKFYDYLLTDPDTKHFFSNTDMQKQRIRQKQFITMITGGPQTYMGKDMKTAHQKMKISKTDFDNMWNHTEHAMKYYKIEPILISQMKELIYSYEKDIVNIEPNPQSQANKSLFERMGGQKAINNIVDKFYQFMLNDPLTGPFFDKTDMKQLSQKQKHFISKVTGGPSKYQGTDMKTAHQKYKIGKKEFDQAWHNWQKSLSFNKVNSNEIAEFKKLLYSMEKEVEEQKAVEN